MAEKIEWTYYLVVAFSLGVGAYGATRLGLSIVGKAIFVMLSLVFGVAAAATGLIHSGPRAAFSFAVCIASVGVMAVMHWVYERPRADRDK